MARPSAPELPANHLGGSPECARTACESSRSLARVRPNGVRIIPLICQSAPERHANHLVDSSECARMAREAFAESHESVIWFLFVETGFKFMAFKHFPDFKILATCLVPRAAVLSRPLASVCHCVGACQFVHVGVDAKFTCARPWLIWSPTPSRGTAMPWNYYEMHGESVEPNVAPCFFWGS